MNEPEYRMNHDTGFRRETDTDEAPASASRPARRLSTGGYRRVHNGKEGGSGGKNDRAPVLLLAVAGLLVIFTVMPLAQFMIISSGFSSAVVTTTYPAKEEDLLLTERRYTELEDGLMPKVRELASGNYDEVRYDLDSIEHDPYVLLSALAALVFSDSSPEDSASDGWFSGKMDTMIGRLFEHQYSVSKDVVTETRYRTEIKEVRKRVRDPETGKLRYVIKHVEERVPYDYVICTVTLENNGLETQALLMMTDEEKERYRIYLDFLGNYPDLFPSSGRRPGYGKESDTDGQQ